MLLHGNAHFSAPLSSPFPQAPDGYALPGMFLQGDRP
jgi:hypothetical protein